jgi:hypothetical protein
MAEISRDFHSICIKVLHWENIKSLLSGKGPHFYEYILSNYTNNSTNFMVVGRKQLCGDTVNIFGRKIKIFSGRDPTGTTLHCLYFKEMKM